MKYLILISLFYANFHLQAASPEGFKDYREWRKNQCQGEWVEGVTCDNGKKQKGHYCVTADSEGNKMFEDGCTVGILKYGYAFHEACVFHDNCFHHEPATNGRTQKECDQMLYEKLKKICETSDVFACRFVAAITYRGARLFAKKRYNCTNSKANYQD